ncbi:putative RNA-binding protein [Pseudolycoriella hygida]|uniref:RNA-binding protein n=1 Tax=Pseudolycoriella hygida TaxID=35572 RepID=A0A9Q0RW03_9DIPT|nr:putative RNA-binding protein [Pseudolycoriella hygida]
MTRIFVGNLPTDIVEKDLENEFAAYGIVNKVEVKHKRDPLTMEIMSTFAFVTIGITDSLLDQCLEEFKNEKFRGRYLTVSVARENFMEKLRREREESTQSSVPHTKSNVNKNNPFRLNVMPNAKQTFNSDNEDSNRTLPSQSYDTEEPLIKRKSTMFFENGKIKIPCVNETNAVMQPAKKMKRKTFDEKSEKADRKRVESLINMKNTYNQQKKMVQQALSNLESTKTNKIIFDEPTTESDGKSEMKTKTLFDDDADDDDLDFEKSFEVKRQYEGEKGARLQKLQSRFANDQRFKMNENFLDDNDDDMDVEVQEVQEETQSDERKWQYDILESVIGKKLQPEIKRKSKNLMLRYDPTKNDHEKYEKVKRKKIRSNEADSEPTTKLKADEECEFQVSKEQFFNVSNQLTAALAPASEGFSLLSMFGRDNDVTVAKPKNPYQEITLSKGEQKMLQNGNSFFKDDSSDDEIIEERLAASQINAMTDSKQTNPKKSSKAEIWHEPFFIFGDDQRLQGKWYVTLPTEFFC